MTKRSVLLFLFACLCGTVSAQQIPVALNEVVISDTQLRDFSATQSVIKLNDSVLQKSLPSLTQLLNYNSTIYFKENGAGMVSSPSFRGTTAQQTAVVWNGININSQLLGQTDFNTVLTTGFDEVSVRSGGGSVLYGSSAIGGSVHLDNQLSFKKHFSNEINVAYGSFDTYQAQYGFHAGDSTWTAAITLSRNGSDNDYEVSSGKKNLNGHYYNNGYNAAFGWKPAAHHTFQFYSALFDGDRHFSLINPTDSKTKYHDFNTRQLLEWDYTNGKITSKTKVAYLTENYRYYGNIAVEEYSFGKVGSLIGKYDITYHFTPDAHLNAIVDYTRNDGRGSDIGSNQRQSVAGALLWRQQVTDKWQYEAGIRGERSDVFRSPLLFSAGTAYQVNALWRLRANISRNYRIPTFDDLYWSTGGNPDLRPESGLLGEIGNDLMYKDFRLGLTFYHGKVTDMIRWVPGSGGRFSPVNTDEVLLTGAEALFNWKKSFGNHKLSLDGTYAYTKSENTALKKQLIYVPYHKATASFSYAYKQLSAVWQQLYVGDVYTQTDNSPKRKVEAYTVGNLLADYAFGTQNVYKAGIRIYNITGEQYESVDGRPMPGRWFSTSLTLIFQ